MKYLLTLIFMTLMSANAMAKEIETEILINATPDKVWSILSKFDDYPKWNPFIKSITGNVVTGNQVKVKITPSAKKEMTFNPKILTYKTNKELSWIGRFILPGLFDGTHKFKLIDNGNGTTTFKHTEKFSGILVWMFNLENTKKGFKEMNKKLKELAEQL